MSDGLDGVVVAQTILGEVDGKQGRLVIRGKRVEDLAGKEPFEAVAARLWQDLSATDESPEKTSAALGARAKRPLRSCRTCWRRQPRCLI